jgi:hypothetical protein
MKNIVAKKIVTRVGFSRMKWIFNLLFSFLFIYLVSFFFYDSTGTWTWSPELEQYIHPDGYIHHMRSEGWGTTCFGEFGIAGIKDISEAEENKILIWGDSYVEAFQVDDSQKMPQLLTKLFKKNLFNNWIAVGIGQSGATISDYYFRIPKYEKIIGDIKAHIIVIAQPDEDIVPNDTNSKLSRFLITHTNQLILEKETFKPKKTTIKSLLNCMHLDFFWNILKKITETKLNLNIKKKSAASNSIAKKNKKYSKECLSEIFNFITKKLSEQTDKDIIILYAPPVPIIEKGRIFIKDENKAMMHLFSIYCKKNNLIFLDLTQDFLDLYKEQGVFPRGFFNSEPSKGHFNSLGHAIVAQKIYHYLTSNNIIVH